MKDVRTECGRQTHFMIDTDAIENMVKDILSDIATMSEKDYANHEGLEIWCKWNSLHDDDFEDDRDKFAQYECAYGIVSFNLYIYNDMDMYADDWCVNTNYITLSLNDLLKLAE